MDIEKSTTGKPSSVKIADNLDLTGKTTTIHLSNDGSALGDSPAANEPKSIHKINAPATETVTDTWKVTVTFMNTAYNQNENSKNKKFDGNIQFTTVDCTSGEEITPVKP